jgi:hypothetical protein
MNPLLTFQLRRIGRNKQYLLFTVLLPALFTVFFTKIFGGAAAADGEYQEYAAGYMVSMMAYGAMGAALGATIRIAFDRPWNRGYAAPRPAGSSRPPCRDAGEVSPSAGSQALVCALTGRSVVDSLLRVAGTAAFGMGVRTRMQKGNRHAECFAIAHPSRFARCRIHDVAACGFGRTRDGGSRHLRHGGDDRHHADRRSRPVPW